ncbi:MAG TPA: T9SS type A sorting domain-containing protein [Flavobacteriales bacterium]|nr:T9SS type A sorting domain-containing protein [Flavobacteriales bacterium]
MSQAVEDPLGRIVAVGTARVDEEDIIAVDRVTNDLETAIETQDRGNLGLVVFPIPFRSDLSLRAEEPLRRVEVMDMEGRLVQSSAPNNVLAHLDLRWLNAGLYMVRAQGDSGVTTRTVIKQ